jgi:tripeptide aminopeptidase
MTLASIDLERLRKATVEKTETVIALTQQICAVPASTGAERQRAEVVAALLRERGYEPEIDEISNVYTIRRGTGSAREDLHSKPALMLLAHIDTVFPFDTPLVIQREGDLLRGPGIGDNSVSVAAMITLLETLDALHIETETDIIAVANVGEEGLGNLCGARKAVERYRSQLGAVIVIDGHLGYIVNSAVGSLRWKITVRGPGGHSFGSFGTPSAIHGLGKIIAAIADLEVPHGPGMRTTFNVGIIEGGTSVNTIAAHASALLDMRSVDVASLQHLAEQVRLIVEQKAGPGLRTEIEILGERPAGQRRLDDPLIMLTKQMLAWVGIEAKYVASSTDANIPISLGIPSVCIGITRCEKAHTVNEYIYLKPIPKGLAQFFRLAIEASALIAS